jgi:antitoxin YefM
VLFAVLEDRLNLLNVCYNVLLESSFAFFLELSIYKGYFVKNVNVNQAKDKIEQLINQTNDNHQPILLSGTQANAVLVAEEDWNAIQETLYLHSIPGMVESIIEGGNTSIEDCVSEEAIREILNG